MISIFCVPVNIGLYIYRPGLMFKMRPVKIKAIGKWMVAFSSVSGRAFGRRSGSEMCRHINPYFCCKPRRGFMSFDPIIEHNAFIEDGSAGRADVNCVAIFHRRNLKPPVIRQQFEARERHTIPYFRCNVIFCSCFFLATSEL